eukprot:4178992-Lingulodinium_polyedra.AAC.1
MSRRSGSSRKAFRRPSTNATRTRFCLVQGFDAGARPWRKFSSAYLTRGHRPGATGDAASQPPAYA